ncbi:MAG: hypothetical protein OEV66_09865 [Spirochaetia bacterium]|nr:hypothetical protein [Spirochaetia bacterium]
MKNKIIFFYHSFPKKRLTKQFYRPNYIGAGIYMKHKKDRFMYFRVIRYCITLLFSGVLFLLPHCLFADIVYLKDGKVFEYATISNASVMSTTFETRSKEQKTVTAAELLRLRYGESEIEPVSLLKKDGLLIDGFLVEQDANTVLIRKNKQEKNEELISKSDIQQMSKNKIITLYPETDLRLGAFYPINTGGSKLGTGFAAMLGVFINPPFLPNSKLGLEAGYIYSNSGTNKGLAMHIIPVLINAQYLIKLTRNTGIDFAPRAGFGGGYVIFNDGEGGSFQSVIPAASAGVGMYITFVPRKVFANIFADYLVFIEGKNALHSLMGTIALQIRF